MSFGYCGAEPVFVDIDADTYNIDASQVETAIGSRTKAILAVHQMGMPCDLATLAALARQHGIALIEDAACAIGSEILWSGQWQPIGRPQSDAACFSFHPRKIITTGDGGMITTPNADWDSRFRRSRQHGMSIPMRHDAAHFVTKRRRLAERYRTLLTDFRDSAAARASMGAFQLAELLHSPAGWPGPAHRNAVDARSRHLDPARDHKCPSRVAVQEPLTFSSAAV